MSILYEKLEFYELFPKTYALFKKQWDELDRLASQPGADLDIIQRRNAFLDDTILEFGISVSYEDESYLSCQKRKVGPHKQCSCKLKDDATHLLLHITANKDIALDENRAMFDYDDINFKVLKSQIETFEDGNTILNELHIVAPLILIRDKYDSREFEYARKYVEDAQEASSSDSKEACP